jgi:hypothetical protein
MLHLTNTTQSRRVGAGRALKFEIVEFSLFDNKVEQYAGFKGKIVKRWSKMM